MIRHTRTLLLCPSLILACVEPDAQDAVLVEDVHDIADDEPARGTPGAARPSPAVVAVQGTLAATKTRAIGGRTYTFAKVVDPDGSVRGVVHDEDGREIDESAVPRARPDKLDRELRAAIDAGDPRRPLAVTVALIEEPETDATPRETGQAVSDGQGLARVTLNGVEIGERELLAANEAKFTRIAAARERRLERHRANLRQIARYGAGIADQPGMVEALALGRSAVDLSLEPGDVVPLLRRFDGLIAGIELTSERTNQLASAMLDTRIDPFAFNSSSQGNGIGIYMSEKSCPGTTHITDYMRLQANGVNPDLSHSENVSAIIRGTSPDSFVYCRGKYQMPTAADLNGYNGNPRVYIESHSWGEITGTTSYRTSDRDWDNHVYNDAVAVFRAAGNLSTIDNPSCDVVSPAKGLNLTTIGNYNDATDTINSSSCHVDSEIGNAKPEISAPGTSITAGGWTMTGTSMATPHAAGFAADMLSDYPWLQLRPYNLKAEMLAGSVKTVSGGTDKVGVGGLDFHRTYFDGTSQWWEGDNASFSYFANTDYLPNNGYIDYQVGLDASLGNVRVALVWLNRGAYTYDHRADAHPLGMDLDMCVYAPNGTVVACSQTYDNPYELVSFDPVVTGTYRVRIARFSNGDPSSKLHMSVAVDW